jgi:hypothetical protein
MIKLFRKKQYDLIDKKNTGKYFKYAFGEIVLDFVGILIALSINNWNTNRRNIQLKKVILNDLKKS